MVSVLLYDEPGLIADGIRSTLAATGRYELVGVCSEKSQAVQCYQKYNPTLVLFEILINNAPWLDIIQEIKTTDPLAKILIFTFISDDALFKRAMDMGAHGYVLKKNHSRLIDAMDQLRSGKLYIDTTFNNEEKSIDNKMEVLANLPKRELAILLSVAQGISVQVIADNMGIATKTVYNTRSRLKERLGAKTQGDLCNIAKDWAIKISAS
jgi:two-component system invasion response regulator UvrY